ncbi:methyltransferase [Streptomyces sp. NPDC127068]|uniref:methyltransferase n=1 Tax=Streptomyces sp. NPDC127068 TaxID=3347127 RepID=UPI003650FECC
MRYLTHDDPHEEPTVTHPSADPADAPPIDHLMQLASGFMASKVLLVAARVGLFTALAEGPVSGDELRDRLDLHPRSAHDFFDTLVALGALERGADGYRNAPAADYYLVRGRPAYAGGFLEMNDSRTYGLWGNLEAALRSGEPQNGSTENDDGMYAHLYADPERLAVFQEAMTGLSMGSAHALAETFDWSPYRTVADVGCAEGAVLTHLLHRHPQLHGIGFDLPAVAPGFRRRLDASGLGERLDFRPGDFFAEPLPRADVLILGHIISGFSRSKARSLLEKAYEALPAGGSLIVYESLLDDERKENVHGLLMSLTMLLETPGGFEYTGPECQEWLAATGFTESRVTHLSGPESMIVAVK